MDHCRLPLDAGGNAVTRPTAHSPIPAAARPIVERVHSRYVAACNRGERPAIDDPCAAVGLLTALECIALAECGYYPIPAQVIRLGMTPAEHQRQQILDALAEQLPDAVSVVLEATEIGQNGVLRMRSAKAAPREMVLLARPGR